MKAIPGPAAYLPLSVNTKPDPSHGGPVKERKIRNKQMKGVANTRDACSSPRLNDLRGLTNPPGNVSEISDIACSS